MVPGPSLHLVEEHRRPHGEAFVEAPRIQERALKNATPATPAISEPRAPRPCAARSRSETVPQMKIELSGASDVNYLAGRRHESRGRRSCLESHVKRYRRRAGSSPVVVLVRDDCGADWSG